MGKQFKWREQEAHVREAVAASFSYVQVISYLGMKQSGGSLSTLKKYIESWNIDTSHMKRKSWNKGVKISQTEENIQKLKNRLDNELLAKDGQISSHKLKEYLYRAGYKIPQCERCKLGRTWNGKSISHQLDHIDGDSSNNELDNLRILCPNCHAQTDTFRNSGKGLKSEDRHKWCRSCSGKLPPACEYNICIRCRGRVTEVSNVVFTGLCMDCGHNIPPGAHRCAICAVKFQQKIISAPKGAMPRKIRIISRSQTESRNKCPGCDQLKTKLARLCKHCHAVQVAGNTKITWPSREELLTRLESTSYVQLGRELGVSDNAIRKRLRKQ